MAGENKGSSMDEYTLELLDEKSRRWVHRYQQESMSMT